MPQRPNQPWHRLREEPDEAFKWFVKFLESEQRVIARFAREQGVEPEKLYIYSGIWEWSERAAKYDDWLHQTAIAGRRKRIFDMNYRHQKIGKEMQELGRYIISKIGNAVGSEEVTLSKDDLAKGVKLVEAGVTTERKAVGEPDLIQETRSTDEDSAEQRLVEQLLSDPEIRIKLAEAGLDGFGDGEGEGDPGDSGQETNGPEGVP